GGHQPGRVLENAGTGLKAERLACLPLNPRLAHALEDARLGIALQLELAGQDHRIIQIAGAVGELELVLSAIDNIAGAVEDLDLADELADLAGAVAGVVPHGAAHGAGRADQRFPSR